LADSYVVQFVGDGAHTGAWWQNASSSSTATVIVIDAGRQVAADAELAPAP
jgi:hypothetical protein